jgi:hypothetical protein
MVVSRIGFYDFAKAFIHLFRGSVQTSSSAIPQNIIYLEKSTRPHQAQNAKEIAAIDQAKNSHIDSSRV